MRDKMLVNLLFAQLMLGCAISPTGDSVLPNCSNAIATSDEGRWYSTDDLPTDEIYSNITKFKGQGHFKLEINSLGKVERCEINLTSGSVPIDKSICANLKRRASYDSFTNSCPNAYRYVVYIVKLEWDISKKDKPRVSVNRF